MNKKQRLTQQQKEYANEYNLLSEKIRRLREQHIIETDPQQLFKLERQLTEATMQRDQLVQKLDALAEELEGLPLALDQTTVGRTPNTSRGRTIVYIIIFVFIAIILSAVFSNFFSDAWGLSLSFFVCFATYLQIQASYTFSEEPLFFDSRWILLQSVKKKHLWYVSIILSFLGTGSFALLNIYFCYNFHLETGEIIITTFLALIIPLVIFRKYIHQMMLIITKFYKKLSNKPTSFISPKINGRFLTSFYKKFSNKLTSFISPNKNIRFMSIFVIILFLLCGSWHTYLAHIADACNGTSGVSLGIGAEVIGKECVGISNGIVPFDLQSPDRSMKLQAAEDLKQGRLSDAEGALDDARNIDPNDAEARIYLEDLQIPSHYLHITLIVDVTLTGQYMAYGREILRGAYTKQRENNQQCQTNPQCIYLSLLIANTGSGYVQESDNANYIANQITTIIDAEQHHESSLHLVGIMDGLSSQSAIDINRTITTASSVSPDYVLPMVAAVATSDYLTTAFAFLRVVPPNTAQGYFGAYYAQNVLHAKNIAILYREENSYSGNLKDDFQRAIPNATVPTQGYKAYDDNSIINALNNLLTAKNPPDLIYCACYSNEVNTVLKELSTKSQFNQLRILGGDTFYELGNYDPSIKPYMHRLFFTALGFPDIPSPAFSQFSSDYNAIFASNFQGDSATINSGVMTAYDATLVLITAATNAFAIQNQAISPAHLQSALFQIKGVQAVQGLTGLIAFDSSGIPKADPSNKALFLLSFDNHGNPIYKGMCGQFSSTLYKPPCDLSV